MNIGCEIDLRADGEAKDIEDSVFGSDVEYHRFPVTPYTFSEFAPYHAALQQVIDNAKAGKASYILCILGADRTGTLIALIEGLCGMSESDIDKDYELTSFAELRNRNSAQWKSMKSCINAYDGDTFSEKIVNFCLGLLCCFFCNFRKTIEDLSTTSVDSLLNLCFCFRYVLNSFDCLDCLFSGYSFSCICNCVFHLDFFLLDRVNILCHNLFIYASHNMDNNI